MVKINQLVSHRRQCELLDLNRSSLYHQQKDREKHADVVSKITKIYTEHPVYGYRRITACLVREGLVINTKSVRKIMKDKGYRAIYPGPRTTISDRKACKYPYLLDQLEITRPHQVWQMDITYLRVAKGYLYLSALIDMHSRYVVGYHISSSLDTDGCLQAFENAVQKHEKPEIINTDQGCQFTSKEWLQTLKQNEITPSMSGKGRSNDNAYIERLWRTLKYEWLFIHGFREAREMSKAVETFFAWYHNERPHQSLDYCTPMEKLTMANDMLIGVKSTPAVDNNIHDYVKVA